MRCGAAITVGVTLNDSCPSFVVQLLFRIDMVILFLIFESSISSASSHIGSILLLLITSLDGASSPMIDQVVSKAGGEGSGCGGQNINFVGLIGQQNQHLIGSRQHATLWSGARQVVPGCSPATARFSAVIACST
jgi:hypothetical protein